MDKEAIKHYITTISERTDDELVHHLKCSLSKKKEADKIAIKPIIIAIDKERKKRGTNKAIEAKKEIEVSQTADDYEGVSSDRDVQV